MLKASCFACCRVTSDLERVCIRDILWALRSLAGLGKESAMPNTPNVGVLPEFLPPSSLQWDRERLNETFSLRCLTARTDNCHQKAADSRPSTYVVNNTTFCRFLCKIAQGYCVKEFGDRFQSFLANIILGKITHLPEIWRFVGGDDFQFDQRTAHLVRIEVINLGSEQVVRARLRLFTSMNVF